MIQHSCANGGYQLLIFSVRAVPPEVEASFITIIDSILAASDLNTISEKRIRKGLQAAVEYDITPQKVHISQTSPTSFTDCALLTLRLGPDQNADNGSV